MLFAGGFSFANFLMDVLTLFAFVIWFWLAISVVRVQLESKHAAKREAG